MPRKFIEDIATYRQKERTLLNLVQSLAHISLDTQKHNINEIPAELTIVFIDKEDMHLFAPMADDDIRTCKIVNYNKPAVELSFFNKHKYYIKKNANPTFLQGFLQEQLTEKKQQVTELAKDILTQPKAELYLIDTLMELLKNYQNEIEGIQHIIDHIDQYEFAISNYEMGYTYTELSYKYQTPEGKYSNENSHIIKDRSGKECINVIFIDQEAMQKPVANQQKKVDSYLASFPIRFVEPSKVFYIKKKE